MSTDVVPEEAQIVVRPLSAHIGAEGTARGKSRRVRAETISAVELEDLFREINAENVDFRLLIDLQVRRQRKFHELALPW
ncbi:hypothetical protein [Paraburkholderia atlantica]|uniref:hypothetical protein n=1 Tax=Paraburkholderia atlantica TaxID=2654982 RepID=UPI00187B9C89|nr:hypothetical protein [Paraburkholderia atlantica]